MSSTILACSFLDNFILLFFFRCLFISYWERETVGGRWGGSGRSWGRKTMIKIYGIKKIYFQLQKVIVYKPENKHPWIASMWTLFRNCKELGTWAVTQPFHCCCRWMGTAEPIPGLTQFQLHKGRWGISWAHWLPRLATSEGPLGLIERPCPSNTVEEWSRLAPDISYHMHVHTYAHPPTNYMCVHTHANVHIPIHAPPPHTHGHT